MLKKFFDKLTYKPDPIRLYSAGISDVGQRRDHNEDNFLIDEKLGLFIVADGMGGHEEGEVASKLAIETLFNHIKKLDDKLQQPSLQEKHKSKSSSEIIHQLLQDAIEDANNQTHCYNLAKGLAEGRGMGTTVTGFLIASMSSALNHSATSLTKKKLYAFNVGDSRTYCYNQGTLKQLSTDHSHYQLWVETGKDGDPPKHNIIYKAIGPWRRVVAEQHTVTIKENDIFLLCSDGLSDMLSDQEIRHCLHAQRKQSLKKMAQALVDAANNAGGKDNISVVLVKPS
ncbi:PP2C family protein-serine/threonine phosphatase [sulfur-oxidizing endosymbiont of Gigantopelta aegis]|uniref:PP2C family protein-serine/threonine phosphatase n=1 Tax=sulfur-oxidizing endosymbiont of Gigantopelta aegis TaxID=2794934 RepID=UPI0018DAF928|nr:protein phosphatase 2C domain-containing protein [sulfur-oxidizing endosymbiont of Gigantopelta aegis]